MPNNEPYPQYKPPDSDHVDFDLRVPAPPWSSADGDRVDYDLGCENAETEQRLLLSPGGTSIGWRGKMRRVDAPVRIPWHLPDPQDQTGTRLGWQQNQARQPETSIPWHRMDSLDLPGTVFAWQQGQSRPGLETCILWTANQHRRDAPETSIPWGRYKTRNREYLLLRLVPLAHVDQSLRSPWTRLQTRDQTISIPWWAGKPHRDFHFRVYWGRELYDRICRRVYDVPDADHVDFDLCDPLSRTGDGDHVDFWFDPLVYDLRCEQREPSGWRDNNFYHPASWPQAEKRRLWIVINTVWLTRLADNAPVPALSVDLSTDIDSWAWNFSARIPAESLPLVMTPNEPTGLRITINGHVWTVLAESWRESHNFARSEYTIQGRSRSAVLAAPYAPEKSSSNADEATARQLAEAQLEYTDWTLDWRICDWLVSARALSYTKATPVKIIQQLAEAAGGRVLSHPALQQLVVVPRLCALPWKWTTSQTPALGINEYVVRQLSREYLPGVAYNAVHISGENQGVLCRIVRQGTDGSHLAPMITDALITATEPARARGELELGKSGAWSKESLDIPLFNAGTLLPGLLEIGTLVQMEEGMDFWRGQVVGLQITAAVESSGGVRVDQHVDIERYRGT